ncbi:hypothetical protein P3T27_002128 [Kitasatospora sp. MAA19]|uniref:hypothetical protein n=1 Tax=Kitasatospora sp. MAA19 TaxID=3035090 RepID=UPI002473E72D|nr:hypothetical protein [Kitasatospora sp. MAA19]MDH6705418.1 hypothetical protein [Kitasatospora sp. MAA19]
MNEDIFDTLKADASVVDDLVEIGGAAEDVETPGTHERFSGFGWANWAKKK